MYDSTEPLIEIDSLSLKYYTEYGEVSALDNVFLSVKKKEVMGVVGESGCGKSSLAKAILNIIPSPPGEIVSGEIKFQNSNLLNLTAQEMSASILGRHITFIPQDPGTSFNPLFPISSQAQDILLWNSGVSRPLLAAILNRVFMKQMQKKFLELLERVQLPSPADILAKFPHEISGGQKQRIMIALALVTAPTLVIADEPTTALDVTVQKQVLHIFRKLVNEDGVSSLFITHNLGVASAVCDSITVMYAGQEMEIGSSESIFSQPSHPYTIKLLGCIPRVSREIQDIPGKVPSLINAPKGCRFYDRCDYSDERCQISRPQRTRISSDHWVRCYNPISNIG